MTRRLARTAALAAPILAARLDAQTTIDFEGLASMPNSVGTTVPLAARLSDQLLGQGLRFSSTSPFVTVVTLGAGHATSGVLGIGASTGNERLTYLQPIFVEFLDPLDPTRRATTDAVSIRVDLQGAGPMVGLHAFDVAGHLIGSHVRVDFGGPLLAVAARGIQRVRIDPNGTTAFDDLTFGALTPVVTSAPEPAALSLAAAGLVPLALLARRRARVHDR